MDGVFGLFSNNLINWLLLIVLLAVLWNKVMPGVFEERRRKVQSALQHAGSQRTEGQTFLKEQQSRIGNAEKEAEEILVESKRVADQMRLQYAEETGKQGDDLRRKLEQQITTERQMAIAELRSQAATVAVRIAEATLPGAITPGVKSRLQEQFVQQLDQVGSAK